MTNLQTKKKELEAQLAEVNRQIEESKPGPVFEKDVEYVSLAINDRTGGLEIFNSLTCAILESRNPYGLFLFKTQERCESFNKKLLELAERQATVEYLEKKIPSPIYEVPSDNKNYHIEVNSDGQAIMLDRGNTGILIENIKALKDYCQDILDWQEQQDLRGKHV